MAPNAHDRGRRAQELRAHGFTWEQIAAVWESDYPEISPRVALRWAHNLTQEQVAELWNELDSGEVTMTKGRVSNFESWPVKGRRPSVMNLKMLARIYQTTARRLLTDDEYLRYGRTAQVELEQIDYRHLDANSRPQEMLSEQANTLTSDTGTTHERASSTVVTARGALHFDVTATTVAGFERAFLVDVARESARLAHIVGQTNIGQTDLDQLDADIAYLARRYLTDPLVPLIGEMAEVRDTTFSLLKDRQYPEQTRHLYALAGQACGLLANASSDLGHYDVADTHARTAWLCAELAGHDKLRAWVLSTRSLIAFWDGRTNDAIHFAEHGTQYSAQGVELVRLRSLEARARARLGDEPGTRAALHAASEARQHVHDEGEYAGMLAFSPGNQERCAGSAYLWLNLPESKESLERALTLFAQETPPETGVPSYAHTTVTRLDLTMAHLRSGDLDGALELVQPVLGLPPEMRLAGVVRRTHVLQRLLAAPALGSRSAAQELAAQIGDFTEHNAARRLTSS
ncbi:helix-turn-helix domain-containing protein [Sphaerisporangium sp. NPDC049003]|uniref:helix-turn-helix domain-containing protein n=1 Tax=Sphaerisporangium sp. NPDC049003 TaxID=3364517 RepID=UPI00371F5AA1